MLPKLKIGLTAFGEKKKNKKQANKQTNKRTNERTK